MNTKIRIMKRGKLVYEGSHEIIDDQSFGAAFEKAWRKMREARLQQTTSVGELMDLLNDEVLTELHDADIRIEVRAIPVGEK